MLTGDPRISVGFSFVELLIVVASAALLLSSVDSWLDDYEIRSRVSDALLVAESARKDIVITCTADQTLQGLSNEIVAHEFPHSPYVGSVDIGGSCDMPQITLETQKTGLKVDPTVVITGIKTGEIYKWICSSNGLESDLPSRCRGG